MIIFKILFGLAILIPMSNSLVRINIWHDKLKQLCFSRGDNLYQDLINHQQKLSSHLANFHVINLQYSSQLNKCQKDINSTLKLELLVDAVQLCMEEQDRLQKDQKEIFISKLLKVICQLHVLGGGKIQDSNCSNITSSKFSFCRQTFQEFQTILLPLIYNTEECSEAKKLLNCLQSQTSECNETTRNEFEAANNVTFYILYGCPHQKEIFDSSNIEEEVLNQNPHFEFDSIFQFNFTIPESSQIEEESLNLKEDSESQPIVRFNFTRTELRGKCNQKDSILSKTIESRFLDFLAVKKEKQFLIAMAVKSESLKSKLELLSVVNENCYNDSEIRNCIENIFNAVEDCLEEEDHFDEEGKEKLLTTSIDKFCSGLDITASLIPSDQECFHEFSGFFNLALCNKNDSYEQGYFENLPLLFASSSDDCSDLYRIQNCKLDVHEKCENSTKMWLQEQFNQERRFTGCEDTMYNTTFVG